MLNSLLDPSQQDASQPPVQQSPPTVPPLIPTAARVKPHGMSLQAKPERIPHPKAAGRDIHGRILPMPKGKGPSVKVAAVVAKGPKGKPAAVAVKVATSPPRGGKFSPPPQTGGLMADRIPNGRSGPY